MCEVTHLRSISSGFRVKGLGSSILDVGLSVQSFKSNVYICHSNVANVDKVSPPRPACSP
jgi:hypothetical protein